MIFFQSPFSRQAKKFRLGLLSFCNCSFQRLIFDKEQLASAIISLVFTYCNKWLKSTLHIFAIPYHLHLFFIKMCIKKTIVVDNKNFISIKINERLFNEKIGIIDNP